MSKELEQESLSQVIDRINWHMARVRQMAFGAGRDGYIIEYVFPLLDQIQSEGYSVEMDESTGLYHLVFVTKGEWTWPRGKLKSLKHLL